MANLNLDIYTDARAQKKTYDLGWLTVDEFRSNADYKCHPLHYGNILEYLSFWGEVQFLNIQKFKKVQEIQKPI